ncbi:hypothetical protein WSS_A11683 [Rhodococcus opacus M213]|uniref:Uncharacterized protein n=1 Tax=Rhodococcus opacus M213 TaxID=1129896 RepID=K8XZ79_RHOOP|nr:hypothetical protein [Rhodococcus opacus]EKT82540.1 hypothetical protein WSS_A11683 [Rhodococcus opacus M213]
MGSDVSVDRDALAGLILAATADAASMIFPGTADYLADELLAAGYRKPRTIVTADGLEALPNGAVILSEQGGVWERQEGQAGSLSWVEATQGRGSPQPSDEIALPATVIHLPEA